MVAACPADGGNSRRLAVCQVPKLQQEPEKLMTVPLTAVNAAAKKYGTPASATLLLVGDLSKIEEGIRKLKLGEIVVLDVEGRQAKRQGIVVLPKKRGCV